MIFVWVELIYIYIYRERERAGERIEQSRVGSMKKVFVKNSMSKRTKSVVFIYFASFIIKKNYYEVWINWNEVYGALSDYDKWNSSFIDYPIILGKFF